MNNISNNSEIRVSNIIKDFGKLRIINDINLSLKSGEIVGLLGPNGAGKTTTFYIILGLLDSSLGDIFLDDVNITNFPMFKRARLGIGYLPQESSVFSKLTVQDNLYAVAETLNLKKIKQVELVKKLLSDFSLENLSNQMAFTLSGGEKRRLEIARAILPAPKFLFMDEPFSGVDPISVNEIQKIILLMRNKGIGILITDHNVRETLKIVDRAYLIHKGKVLSEGNSEYLINDPESKRLYLGEDFNI